SEKITSSHDLLSLLGSSLGIDIQDWNKDLLQFDKKTKKTIILIDEGQNLFLAKHRGFDAYKLLTSIMNLRTENLFWFVIFNRYSWAYLNAVMGGSQFFRKVFKTSPWSDEEIQDLIMNRHNKSTYELEFDPILFAIERR